MKRGRSLTLIGALSVLRLQAVQVLEGTLVQLRTLYWPNPRATSAQRRCLSAG
jgi:hypothetical protein